MDQVDAPVGLERPHVEVAAQLADRVDPDHLAERARARTGRDACGASCRGAPPRTRAPARACRRRAGRGRGTRAPAPPRAPPRAGAWPQPAREPSRKLVTDLLRDLGAASRGVDRASTVRGTWPRSSCTRRRGAAEASSSLSIRSGSPVIRARALRPASSSSDERRVGQQAAGRRQVQLVHRVDAEPARDALVGERRVEVAVADDRRAALERRPDHALDELGAGGARRASPRPTPSSRARRGAPRAAARRAASRRARGGADLAPSRATTRREGLPGSTFPSRRCLRT